MNNNCLNNSIDKLGIDNETFFSLSKYQINSIRDLWNLSRKDLKKINLSDEQINKIIIKMQLLGIDLNRKVYNKN